MFFEVRGKKFKQIVQIGKPGNLDTSIFYFAEGVLNASEVVQASNRLVDGKLSRYPYLTCSLLRSKCI